MTLRKQALALYTPPFRYSEIGYVIDSNGKIAADAARLECSFDENEEMGAIIAEALNAFWEKHAMTAEEANDIGSAMASLDPPDLGSGFNPYAESVKAKRATDDENIEQLGAMFGLKPDSDGK